MLFRSGGAAPSGTTAVSGQNSTQTMSFSAHPYWRQPFSDVGTAELGAMLSRTSQSGLAASQSAGQVQPVAAVPGQAQFAAVPGQNAITEQEYFSLTSGPAFGRTNAGLQLSGTQETGTGVLSNAHQDQAVVNLGYAITRSVTALASVGYDDVHYAGTPPFNFSGAQWSGGAHWKS